MTITIPSCDIDGIENASGEMWVKLDNNTMRYYQDVDADVLDENLGTKMNKRLFWVALYKKLYIASVDITNCFEKDSSVIKYFRLTVAVSGSQDLQLFFKTEQEALKVRDDIINWLNWD